MTVDLIKQSLHCNQLQLDPGISGTPSSPDVLLFFLRTIPFQSILSEADNGEVMQSHLF